MTLVQVVAATGTLVATLAVGIPLVWTSSQWVEAAERTHEALAADGQKRDEAFDRIGKILEGHDAELRRQRQRAYEECTRWCVEERGRPWERCRDECSRVHDGRDR